MRIPPTPGFLRRLKAKPLAWILLSSLAWALCYPPFGLGSLAFAVLVPALLATSALSGREAFWYNFLGGLAYNTVMYWWLYNVMKVGPAAVILSGLILLILFLSLFNGLLGWMFRRCLDIPRGWGMALFPVLWSGLEVLRTSGEMSFPWSNLGYALGGNLHLIQAVSLFGTFGLSGLMVASNVLLFWFLRGSAGIGVPPGFGAAPRRRFGPAIFPACALAIFLGLWGYGSFSLSRPDPGLEGTLDISLVQPSIPQTKKWNENYFREVMQKTWETMEGPGHADSALLGGSDLIVLAETAVPDFLKSRPDLEAEFQKRADRYGSAIIVGALDFAETDLPHKPNRLYNSAFAFRPGAADKALQYSKLRLVPFSERLPFEDFLPLINYVNLGEGDFSPGGDYAIWGDKARYSPSICYEILYPDFVRGAKERGARLLVNITNDGWFGKSNAPFQHANIARFRAVETGLPIARCSNAGISLFYDYKGRIIGQTRLFEKTVLRRELSLTNASTPYLAFGNSFENALLGIFLVGVPGLAYRARRNRKGNQPA